MKATMITEQQASYKEQGFCIFPEPILPPDLVKRAIAGMDAIRAGDYETGVPPDESRWNPGDDPNKLCKMENPQVASRAIMELIRHPALGQLAGQLMGAQWIRVWWVQLLYKPKSLAKPDDHTSIGWHTDREYSSRYWEKQSELFTAWVGLSDVTEQSGPMRFVPGSHKWDFADQGSFDEQDLSRVRQSIRLPDGEQWREVPALMASGGVSFHSEHALHGSGQNHSDEPRRSIAISMRTEKSCPIDGRRVGLTEFYGSLHDIDDEQKCPIVYRSDE